MASAKEKAALELPPLYGKVAIVTGANSGIGYHMAAGLARLDAHVILATRSESRGRMALAQMRQEVPRARLEWLALDLADLASVRRFAEEVARRHPAVDLLVNNAGLMAIPFQRTQEGFELQFGTNHLGHFALTGLLLEPLLQAPAARVVTISSGLHRRGRIDFDNLQGERRYHMWHAYSQSKLANLLFAYELQRRFEASAAHAISVAAHPGYAATNLQQAGPRLAGSRLRMWSAALGNWLLAQSAEMGALPGLHAAAAPDVRGGDFIGPNGWGGMRGYPVKEQSSQRSYDRDVGRRLWEVSEQLTGVRYARLRAPGVGSPPS